MVSRQGREARAGSQSRTNAGHGAQHARPPRPRGPHRGDLLRQHGLRRRRFRHLLRPHSTAETIERLLTPLEALQIFRAEETTPTAPLRDDHFEREGSLVRGKLSNGDGRRRQSPGRPQVGGRTAGWNHLRRRCQSSAGSHDRPPAHRAREICVSARRAGASTATRTSQTWSSSSTKRSVSSSGPVRRMRSGSSARSE